MSGQHQLTEELGPTRVVVDLALAQLAGGHVMRRLWQRDRRLWATEEPADKDHLRWLDIPERDSAALGALTTLAREARAAGYRRALVMGVGGAVLAPALYRCAFDVPEGFLDLAIVDTTHPATVGSLTASVDPEQTLFIAAAPSGAAVETLALLKHFFGHASARLGGSHVGEHFVTVTDPGSPLAEIAEDWSFRAAILVVGDDANLCTALTPYGLLPAALMGHDVDRLLDRAREMAGWCGPDVPVEDNPASRLGVILAELARAGRDKLTLLVSNEALGQCFGDWLEQLVSGRTGKDGRGILPVVGEPLGLPSEYGPDRLFVCLDCDESKDLDLEALKDSGHPLVRLRLRDRFDLGGQVVLWDLATAVACHRLQVDPVDRPDEAPSAEASRRIIDVFKESGELALPTPALSDGVLTIFGDVTAETPLEAFKDFLARIRPPEYLAIMAYLAPDEATTELLEAFRDKLRLELGVAVTTSFGPRCLHTTGQLHKGDGGHGRFLLITADDPQDVKVPDEMGFQQGVVSFSTLTRALAVGDHQALREGGRKALRIHLGEEVVTGLTALTRAYDPRRTSSFPPAAR